MNKDAVKIIQMLTLLEISINQTLTVELINNQYRKLAKIYHPDVANSRYIDGIKFKELKQAQEYLIDNINCVNGMIQSGFSSVNTNNNENTNNQYFDQKRQEELRRRQEELRKQEELKRQEELKKHKLEQRIIKRKLFLKNVRMYFRKYRFVFAFLLGIFILAIYLNNIVLTSKVLLNYNYEMEDKIIEVKFIDRYTLPIITRPNFTFVGWKDKNTGSYINEISSFSSKDYELEAIWSRPLYFYSNDETGVVNRIIIQTDNSVIQNINFVRNGYTFAGWSSKPNGNVEYINGATYKMNTVSSFELYAVWDANNNQLSFNANGGNGTMFSQIIASNQITNINQNQFTKEGYTFIGWGTTINGPVQYQDGAAYQMGVDANQTLYAQWEGNLNSISFDANGGTGIMQNQLMKTDQIAQLQNNQFSRIGYSFTGWSTTPYGMVEYENSEQYTMGPSGCYTLYAQWSKNAYLVVYQLNGGTYDDMYIDQFYYQDLVLPNNQPTKVGYIFDGWYLDSNFINSIDGYTMPAQNITIFAKWTLDDQAFSLELVGDSEVTIERNSTYQDLGAIGSYSYSNECEVLEIYNDLNTNIVGNYQIRYGIKDIEGTIVKTTTRYITVVDTIEPKLISSYDPQYVYDKIILQYDEEIAYYPVDNGNTWISGENKTTLTLDGYSYNSDSLSVVVSDSSNNISITSVIKTDFYKPTISFYNYRSYDSYLWGLGFTTDYQVDIKIVDNVLLSSYSIYFNNNLIQPASSTVEVETNNGKEYIVYRLPVVRHNQSLQGKIKVVVVDIYGTTYTAYF